MSTHPCTRGLQIISIFIGRSLPKTLSENAANRALDDPTKVERIETKKNVGNKNVV